MTDDKNKCDLEGLIHRLANCPESVPKAMGCPVWRGFIAFLSTVIFVGAALVIQGMRDNMVPLFEYVCQIELLGALLLGLSAFMASTHLMAPDCYGRRWLVIIPFVLFGALVVKAVASYWMYPLDTWHFHSEIVYKCWFNFWVFSFVPLAYVIYRARKGATIYPVQLAFLQSLGVGAIGWIGQRLTCEMDSPQYVYLIQWSPVLIVGTLLGVFARRLYRW